MGGALTRFGRAARSRIRRLMRVACVVVLSSGLTFAACARTQPASSDPWFVDATSTTGLAFSHYNGRSGQFDYPEVIAPGVALFDADGDGDLDVLLMQGADFSAPDRNAPRQSRFFRNDLHVRPDGSRNLTFSDATA